MKTLHKLIIVLVILFSLGGCISLDSVEATFEVACTSDEKKVLEEIHAFVTAPHLTANPEKLDLKTKLITFRAVGNRFSKIQGKECRNAAIGYLNDVAFKMMQFEINKITEVKPAPGKASLFEDNSLKNAIEILSVWSQVFGEMIDDKAFYLKSQDKVVGSFINKVNSLSVLVPDQGAPALFGNSRALYQLLDLIQASKMEKTLNWLIMGSFLGELPTQLSKLAEIHDLGCIIAGGCKGEGTQGDLDRFVTAIATEDTQLQGWTPPQGEYVKILSYLKSFKSNLSEARNDNRLPVRRLTQTFDVVRAMKRNRDNRGVLLGLPVQYAESGLSSSRFDAVLQYAQVRNKSFDDFKAKIKDSKTNELLQRLSQDQGVIATKRIENEIKKAKQDREMIVAERDADQKFSEAEAKLLETSLENISKLMASPQYQQAYSRQFEVVNDRSIQISGRSSKFPLGTAGVSGVNQEMDKYVQFRAVPKNDVEQVIEIQIDGQWSPHCALKAAYPDTKIPALTGPEGYAEAISRGGSTRGSMQEGRVHRQLNSADCNRMRRPDGTGYYDPCSGENSYVNQMSLDKEEFTSNALTYASGLRLPNTPVPTAPAGSLLALIYENDSFRYAQVLSSRQTIKLSPKSEIWLLVNDCDGGGDPVNSLQVSVSALTPITSYANAALTAMKSIDSEINSVVSAVVATGDLSGLKADALRKRLYDQVTTKEFRSLRVPHLAEWFDYWVSRRLHEIETKIRIRARSRELYQLDDRIELLEAELASAQAGDSMRDVLAYRARQDLELLVGLSSSGDGRIEFPALNFEILDFTRMLRDTLVPFVKFYTKQLKKEDVVLINNARSLINIKYEQDTKALADHLLAVSDKIVQMKGADIAGGRDIFSKTIVVSLGKDQDFPQASVATTSKFWGDLDALESRKNWTSIKVSPEEVYFNDEAIGIPEGTLNCLDEMAYIETLSVVVPFEADTSMDEVSGSYKMRVRAAEQMSFADAAGFKTWFISDPRFREASIPILVGKGFKAEQLHDQYYQRTRNEIGFQNLGWSPFSTMSFDLSALRKNKDISGLLTSNKRLLLVMGVKVRNSKQKMDWINTCKNMD